MYHSSYAARVVPLDKQQTAPGLPAAQIATIKPDGSGFQAIVDDGINNGFPSWSPDGKKIVYRRAKQLVIRTLADGKTTALTDGSHYDNFPAWAPNGSVILFTSDRSDGRFELYTIRPDGTDLKRLTNVPGSNAHAAWSSDGAWISLLIQPDQRIHVHR